MMAVAIGDVDIGKALVGVEVLDPVREVSGSCVCEEGVNEDGFVGGGYECGGGGRLEGIDIVWYLDGWYGGDLGNR